MPCHSARTKLWSRRFCPRQNWNCPGQKFLPMATKSSFAFKSIITTIFMGMISKIWIYMPRPSARTKLLSRRFCPRQNWNCQGQKFCPRWKRQFFSVKILSKWLFLVEYKLLSQEKSFWVTFYSQISTFQPWTKIMSWTILILSWTK